MHARLWYQTGPYHGFAGDRTDNVAKASVLTSFHAAVVGGGAPQYGAANAQVDWELCLAVRESARRGNAWVALPLGAPTALEEEVEAEFRRRYGHDPIEETEKLLAVFALGHGG